jgi:hypothetical protein
MKMKMKMKALNNSRFVYTKSSSFMYRPSLTINLNYCTLVESSLVQLSADIEFVYNDLRKDKYDFCPYKFGLIQQKVISGLYVLSPLQIKYLMKGDFKQSLHDTLLEIPDFMFIDGDDPDYILALMPQKDDVMVFMGLSLLLYRLSNGSKFINKYGYRYLDKLNYFYDRLHQMENVDRLYKLDLKISLNKIPLSLVLDKVKSLVGEGTVYKLISSIFDLPIIDEYGNNMSDLKKRSCIPPMGEITRVLIDIVLMECFDREFVKRFPGIEFYRCLHEVYISIRKNDDVIFDEKALYALLEEAGLVEGRIQYIEPDYEPLTFLNKQLIFITFDRKVHVRDFIFEKK